MIRSTCSPRRVALTFKAHGSPVNTRRGLLHHKCRTMSSQRSGGATARVFPPLYVSAGNVSADRLAFFHILERLKVRALVSLCDQDVYDVLNRRRNALVGWTTRSAFLNHWTTKSLTFTIGPRSRKVVSSNLLRRPVNQGDEQALISLIDNGSFESANISVQASQTTCTEWLFSRCAPPIAVSTYPSKRDIPVLKFSYDRNESDAS